MIPPFANLSESERPTQRTRTCISQSPASHHRYLHFIHGESEINNTRAACQTHIQSEQSIGTYKYGASALLASIVGSLNLSFNAKRIGPHCKSAFIGKTWNVPRCRRQVRSQSVTMANTATMRWFWGSLTVFYFRVGLDLGIVIENHHTPQPRQA
jgi:hypothetical protein